jgi:hypothetical protein
MSHISCCYNLYDEYTEFVFIMGNFFVLASFVLSSYSSFNDSIAY